MNNVISQSIIEWYWHNRRDLPWRKTRNPYIIWISEIILQQTRVVQGLPYFYRFIDNFPTVEALATASEQEVLRCWQGLGYYSRARNMHATAQRVVAEYGGVFPSAYAELIQLKGIGAYTAAAVASFAAGESVAVLDGNVIRVLTRLFNIHDDMSTEKNRKKLLELAQSLLPAHNSSAYNQGVMEFGALQCLPANPACGTCVLQAHCLAFQHKTQQLLPIKLKKTAIKTRYFHYLVFVDAQKNVYMKTRGAGDIWQGLYDFYCIEAATAGDSFLSITSSLPKEYNKEDWTLVGLPYSLKHVLTHQVIHINFWQVEINKLTEAFIIENNLIPLNLHQVHEVPKPVPVKSFFEKHFFLTHI